MTIYRASHPYLKDNGMKFESAISKGRVRKMLAEAELPSEVRDNIVIRSIPSSR